MKNDMFYTTVLELESGFYDEVVVWIAEGIKSVSLQHQSEKIATMYLVRNDEVVFNLRVPSGFTQVPGVKEDLEDVIILEAKQL